MLLVLHLVQLESVWPHRADERPNNDSDTNANSLTISIETPLTHHPGHVWDLYTMGPTRPDGSVGIKQGVPNSQQREP